MSDMTPEQLAEYQAEADEDRRRAREDREALRRRLSAGGVARSRAYDRRANRREW